MTDANLKTRVNDADVNDFLNSITDEQKRKDSIELLRIFTEVTGQPAKMWGSSIVGFGSYHYIGSGGREADWLAAGFSPRKQNLTVYLMNGVDNYKDLADKLGPYKSSISCLYIKRLSDIDTKILKEMIKQSYTYVTEKLDQSEK